MSARIARRFAALKREGRAGLVTFLMAGDPDYDTSLAIISALPKAGADVIEIGMPFTDPMADGPAIQAAGLRALKGGQTLKKTLQLVREFRKGDADTPIVLMGYYNPIYIYGVDRFLADAIAAGIDGLIVVDLPPEEDSELCIPALKAGLNFIRLATPTTDDKRLPAVLANTSGFVYYVSITGITGSATPNATRVSAAVRTAMTSRALTGIWPCSRTISTRRRKMSLKAASVAAMSEGSSMADCIAASTCLTASTGANSRPNQRRSSSRPILSCSQGMNIATGRSSTAKSHGRAAPGGMRSIQPSVPASTAPMHNRLSINSTPRLITRS